ncbi:MAG TPA: hypothetical protein VFE98_03155 [Candidatus Bathyarchaeia archaeon]|nr:hypothetical protein [Candidatus Bathyarchaeia archaeon]
MCSTKPEADPSELVKTLARPFVWEPIKDSVPLKDLNNEVFSARLEAEANDALKDLNSKV